MTDFISREEAFNAILKLVPKVDDDGYCWVIRGSAATAIDSVKSADVVSGGDFRDCRNELCLKCGNYKQAHNGACDGCRWRRK